MCLKQIINKNYLLIAITCAATAITSISAFAKDSSIKPFLIYTTGNGYFSNQNIIDGSREAAHYPVILGVNRFMYRRSNQSMPFSEIHTYNPSTKIALYQVGTQSYNDINSQRYTLSMNGIDRWAISRGHPGGTVGNYAMVDGTGNYICGWYENNVCHDWWMDFGSTSYQDYWVQATINDVLHRIHSWPNTEIAYDHLDPITTIPVGTDRPWKSDGIFVDVSSASFSLPVAGYSNITDWQNSMRSFTSNLTAQIRASYPTQLMYFNVSYAWDSNGSTYWATLDQLPASSRPDGLLEEGAFAVKYGAGDVQFYDASIPSNSKWINQVNTLKNTANTKALYEGTADLTRDQDGYDNFGKPVNFWDVVWYSMTSYLLGKNDVANNSYFTFYGGNDFSYLDEYDIDIGKAVNNYQQSTTANSIYWREYDKGWVFVNPTQTDVFSYNLPLPSKLINHTNFLQAPPTIGNISSIALASHRGVIVLKDPVIGDWKLDGSATDSHQYLPGQSFVGQVFGNPTWQSNGGKLGGAIQFHGSSTNDYIAVNHPALSQSHVTNQLTIMAWVNPNVASPNSAVLEHGTYNQSGWQLIAGSDYNGLAFSVYGNNSSQIFWPGGQNTPLPANTWSHVAITVENKVGGQVRMYVNGAPFKTPYTLSTPFVSNSSDVLYMGAHKGGTNNATYWIGQLDNVKILSKVASPTEIQTEYQALVANWKLDEPKYRKKAFDSVGTNSGILKGNPLWQPSSGPNSSGAIQFNGSGDYIAVDNQYNYSAQLQTPDQMTLSAWVMPGTNTASPNSTVLERGIYNQSGWQLIAGSDYNPIAFSIHSPGKSQTIWPLGKNPLPTNTWSHIVVTVDNKTSPTGTVKIYLNGTLYDSPRSLDFPLTMNPNDTLYMGSHLGGAANGATYWSGKLSNVKIFNRVLSDTEVAQLQ